MRRFFLLFSLALFTASLLRGGWVSAQQTGQRSSANTGPTASQCIAQMQGRMSQQRRMYHDVLFGRADAKDEPTGSVRHDEEGVRWIKTKEDAWRTENAKYKDVTRKDVEINNGTEWEGMNEALQPSQRLPRLGIFASTGSLTSVLVPSLTHSYRALRCRAEGVCKSVRMSMDGVQPGADGTFIVEVPGCAIMRAKPLERCDFSGTYSGSSSSARQTTPDAATSSIVRGECEPLVNELMAREAELLKLATGYDAAYRSLLQFAGEFDLVLEDFKGDLLTPIEQSMSFVGYLTRIPCFLAACNG